MTEDELAEYTKLELEQGQEILTRLDSALTPQERLRKLYRISENTHVVYAESGGLSNVDCFPIDTLIVIPIFPYQTVEELESGIGDLQRLRTLIDEGRVYPVIQNPNYYKKLPHLDFLFEANAPSYFIRGIYAYSALLESPPIIERSEFNSTPVLKEIAVLMNYCESQHREWLQKTLDTTSSWEYRYRQFKVRDEEFFVRLRQSLCYRYASVATILGKSVTDRIIGSFPHEDASRILLHLHITFDHVICHGFGSDFVVRPQSPEGNDYIDSHKTRIMQLHEYTIPNKYSVCLPLEPDEFASSLLREEHFLRGVDLRLLSPDSIFEIQHKLNMQFTEFQCKMERVEKSKNLARQTFEFTLLGLGIADMIGGATIPGITKIVAGMRVPWLIDQLAEVAERLFRGKLANYIIDTTK